MSQLAADLAEQAADRLIEGQVPEFQALLLLAGTRACARKLARTVGHQAAEYKLAEILGELARERTRQGVKFGKGRR